MELIPDSVSSKDIRDEANRRASKKGYCTRYGEPEGKTRPSGTVSFGIEKLNIWPRDKNGNLIE